MRVLGIETSCDETAVAIVEAPAGAGPLGTILANVVYSQQTEPVDFPYLLLLVSGGHCQLLTVRGPGAFTRLGTTIDDAVGECFDKTAKLLGLGFPGGPAVERLARDGDAKRFALPRPMWRK